MDANEHDVRGVTIRPGVILHAAGSPPKTICEYAGRLASDDQTFSVAVMRSPAGWTEPPQVPEFRELTAVLEGRVVAHLREGSIEARAGESIDVAPGVSVRYETPEPAVYVAVCQPAFSPELAQRAGTTEGPPHEGGEGWQPSC
jgi:mannose-6-phosphate isomerase-like protein (cupin superfamily)